MTTKGVAKAILNVKHKDGTLVNGKIAVAQMKVGDYVYGTLSSTGSDIVDFDHFYRADKSLFPLNYVCKVTAASASMTLSTEDEPGTPPPPPPTGKKVVSAIIVFDDGTSEDLVPAP